jgi:hypothetical protein
LAAGLTGFQVRYEFRRDGRFVCGGFRGLVIRRLALRLLLNFIFGRPKSFEIPFVWLLHNRIARRGLGAKLFSVSAFALAAAYAYG